MIVSLAIVASTCLATSQSQDAKDLLQRVEAAYARLSSYHDTVQVVTDHPGGTDRQTFKTWFSRPGKWRLEYHEPQPTGRTAMAVMWANVKSVWVWHDGGRKAPLAVADVGAGVESLARVAGQYIETVPGLLDPRAVNDRALSELTSVVLLPEAKLGGEPCYRVSGRDSASSNVTFWFEKRRLLILKIENSLSVGSLGDATMVATYSPVPNLSIPPTTFEFKPPK